MPKKKTKKTNAKSKSAITSDAQMLGQMIRKRSEKISGKLRYDENDKEIEPAQYKALSNFSVERDVPRQ